MIDVRDIEEIYKFAAKQVIAREHPLEALWLQSPRLAEAWAREFVGAFPGSKNNLAYAVKANHDPIILQTLHNTGIENFEVATLMEAHAVSRALNHKNHRLWFHNPLNSERQLKEAYSTYGARDFVVTDQNGLRRIRNIMPDSDSPSGVRLSVRVNVDAGKHTANGAFSHLFPPDYRLEMHAVPLVTAVAERGFRCSLYFNISTQTTDPGLYAQALEQVNKTIGLVRSRGRRVDLETINVGAGFPAPDGDHRWEGYQPFFEAISSSRVQNTNGEDVPFAAEPGRALVAPAEALMIPINQIGDNRLILSTSLVGGWHHTAKLPDVAPLVCAIAGDGRELDRKVREWRIFGGSPASFETSYAKPLALPADLEEGDYLLVLMQGAYGRTLASGFNGLSPNRVLRMKLDKDSLPTALSAVSGGTPKGRLHSAVLG